MVRTQPRPSWILALAAVVGMAACRPTRTEPSSDDPSSRPSAAAAPSEAGPSAEIPPAEVILLRARGDVDGKDGEEELVLRGDGTLVAGRFEGQAAVDRASDYWMKKQARLKVVALDAGTHVRVVLLELPALSEEDPPNRVQLFVVDGERLRRVLDWTPTGYGPVSLDLPGDGSLRYVEDGWTACDRAKHPSAEPVARERVTLRMTGEPGAEQMTEVEREPSGLVQRCDELAACPHVYVLDGDRATYVGEILRHLRGAAAYDRQSLGLPSPPGDVLRVRIAEEKPEVTHLDAIALSVDGRLHLPLGCHEVPLPEHCEVDHAATRLGPGEVLELAFEVPRDARTIELVGWGFYLPQRQP